MIAMRCKNCLSVDLTINNGILVCNSCGKELKLYMTEFVLVNTVLIGDNYRFSEKSNIEKEIITVRA